MAGFAQISTLSDATGAPTPTQQVQSKRAEKYGEVRDTLTSMAVSHPLSPDAYKDLYTGPLTSIEMGENQQEPIDGSDALLRGLSPFMLQIELPLVFGQDGGFVNQSPNNVNVNTFDNANGVADLYASARSSVVSSGIGAMALNAMGVPSDPNPPVKQTNKGADGATASDSGQVNGRMGFPAIADQNVAMDIAKQLITMLNVPPLVLLINPHQLQMSMTKVQSYQDRTRYGYIFHTWGEEQPKMTINAKCGAFISGGRGVHFTSKHDSASWQNLMNLFRFYKNNGYIHDTVGKSNAHHFVGALSITYDGWIYYGHLESFSWNYEETTQHGGIDFSMEFTVSRAVDTGKVVYAVAPMMSPIPSISDPRYSGVVGEGNDGPGVYTIGKDGITSMGQSVSAGDIFSSLVPRDLNKLFHPGAETSEGNSGQTQSQPAGLAGFQSVAPVSERTVQQSVPGASDPFQVG